FTRSVAACFCSPHRARSRGSVPPVLASLHFFSSIRARPPTSTLFPYTTLFRSHPQRAHPDQRLAPRAAPRGPGRLDPERRSRADPFAPCPVRRRACSGAHRAEAGPPRALAADLVTVRSRSPLGLIARQKSIGVPADIRVLPPFVSRRELPSKTQKLRELEGRSAVMIRGMGTEFDSLREYV